MNVLRRHFAELKKAPHVEEQQRRRTPQQVEWKLIPIPNLYEAGKDRIADAIELFKDEQRQEEWLDATGKNFAILGPLLQNELLRVIKGIDNKTKMIFVDITRGCNDENFCRFTRPARLVSYLVGTPDELYDQEHFMKTVLVENGECGRDWKFLSTADLFRNRSELIGSLHYSTPWGVECYAVFDIDPKNGAEVKAERQRKQHLMMTPEMARKLLYKYNADLRRLYELVSNQLGNCVNIFEKYATNSVYTELSSFDFGIYQ